MAQFMTLFDHTLDGHCTMAEWCRAASAWHYASPQSAAKVYARLHGEAKILRSDDSVLRFWRDGEKVRQRTYRKVIHSR